MACRFKESDVREMGRTARGVRGMELRQEDGTLGAHIVSMSIVDPAAELLVISSRGMGKRSRLGHGVAELDQEISGGGYRLTRRGSKGVTSIKLKPGDSVVQAIQLEQDEDLIMTSLRGLVVRINTKDIRTLGRSSQGVRIMRLREDDVVSVVTKVAKLEDDGEDGGDDQENVVVAQASAWKRPHEREDDFDPEEVDDEGAEEEDIDEDIEEDIEEEVDDDEDTEQ